MFEILQGIEGDWRIWVNSEDYGRAAISESFTTKVEAAQALLKAAAEEVIHILSEAD